MPPPSAMLLHSRARAGGLQVVTHYMVYADTLQRAESQSYRRSKSRSSFIGQTTIRGQDEPEDDKELNGAQGSANSRNRLNRSSQCSTGGGSSESEDYHSRSTSTVRKTIFNDLSQLLKKLQDLPSRLKSISLVGEGSEVRCAKCKWLHIVVPTQPTRYRRSSQHVSFEQLSLIQIEQTCQSSSVVPRPFSPVLKDPIVPTHRSVRSGSAQQTGIRADNTLHFRASRA
eukprot:8138740-Pyramimonas_sp.AAC.1